MVHHHKECLAKIMGGCARGDAHSDGSKPN